MGDLSGTNSELIEEISLLRQRIKEFEQMETERKREEATLVPAEEKYRTLIEKSRSIIFTITPDGTFTFVSPGWKTSLGHEYEEVVGRDFRPFVHQDDISKFEQFLRKTGESETTQQGREFRVFHKDGSIRWFRSNITPVFETQGKAVSFVGNAVDFTEHKHAEEALNREKRFAESLIETAQAIILILDPRARIVSFNRYMEELSGYRLEEVKGKDWFSTFILGEERNGISTLFQRAIGDIETQNIVNAIRTREGRIRSIQWHNRALKDDYGSTVGLLSIGIDITSRLEAEKALRVSEERFRLFMDNSPTLAWIKDEAGRYVYLSKTCEQRFGRPMVDWHEKTDAELWPRTVSEELRRNDLAVLAGGQAIQVSEETIDPDGNSRHWLNCKFPLSDAAGNRFVAGIGIDITERKRGEEELEQYRNHLEQLIEERTSQLKNSESRYRTLFESSNDAIWIVKQDVVVECNDKALEMFRCTREQAINKRLLGFFPPFQPDGSNSTEKAMEKRDAAASGTPQRFEWRHLRSDGTLFDTEMDLHAIELGNEKILQAVVRDISERKGAEEALRQSEEKFRLLFEKSADPILLFDGDVVIDCNEIALQYMRCTRQDLIGKHAAMFSPEIQPDGRTSIEKVEEAMNHTSKEGSNHFEWVHRTFDGEDIWLDVSATLVPIQGKEITYTVWRDIGERKRAEETLRQKEEELLTKAVTLEELNTALRVLLRQREEDRKDLEERFAENVKTLVLPYVETMRKSHLDSHQNSCLHIIEMNLNDIVSPFLHTMRNLNLTPRETQVASLIRTGKSTKEIAEVIGVGLHAIDAYRKSIRNKLKLTDRKINLQMYLQSLGK